MTATIPNMHVQTCADDHCGGCYPDLRVAPITRTPGPKRDADGLSVDQRRTRDNKLLIARDIHPATRVALAGNGHCCGDCSHAQPAHHGNFKGWKCELHRLGMSHSAASDIRISWPACRMFEEKTS